jgi:ActR/RegA family two-component response regulator
LIADERPNNTLLNTFALELNVSHERHVNDSALTIYLGNSQVVEEMSNNRADRLAVPSSSNSLLHAPMAISSHVHTTNETAFALVIDDEKNISELVATTLGELGIESATFSTAKPAVASIDQRWPVIIFLDVALEQSDAYDVIRGLSEKHYDGIVQLMSSGRPWLLAALQRLATRHGLRLCPPIQKPIRSDTIRAVIASVGLTDCFSLPIAK